ncbi:MAG: putative glycosyltransferase, possible methyltransferase [archaeon GW2011_AR17]|nr:MAG: putative glycosyltransferase, possible methyltransferase [archaeon GW2011_AR17]MBS3154095.1 class I SAM-dependent methyltransferase [Candidatus Woesearchaeota archaeon]HIH14687.1 class I SAM-dependent methyltransferase [Nanoarchaeota archaeon]HIH59140.1 class I SAM-dependent methyltransferase [Nanoarchaeota archaeon]HII14368.1 class I SAM-dependent methyltransferase [Nanoarchaeota archaeon]
MYEKEYFEKYKEQSFKWKFWARFIQKKIKKEDNILEVGCTYGYLFKYLKDYPNKYGIDISEHAIKQAKMLSQGAEYKVMDAQKLDFKDNFFSLVIAIDVMEHIKNPEKGIKEAARVLKEEGIFIMVTPNLNSYSKQIKGDKWFAYQDKTHVSLLPKEQWIELLEKNNFEIKKIRTIDMFDMPNKKFSSIVNLLSYTFSLPYSKSKKRDNILIIARKL